MKTLLSIVVLIAFALCAEAIDPTYSPQTLKSDYIVAAGQTSNSVAAVIDCRKQQNVALQWNVASTTFVAGTNLTANFSASVDGTTYDTNHWAITMTANNLVTNLNVQGIGYVRLDSVTATGVAATNNIYYGIKMAAP